MHFLPAAGGAPEIEVAHHDPSRVRWAREILERFRYYPQALTGVPAVIRMGRLEFIRDVDDMLVEAAIDAEDVATRLGAAIEAVLPIPQRGDDLALVILRVMPNS